jgi:hypothetical protein
MDQKYKKQEFDSSYGFGDQEENEAFSRMVEDPLVHIKKMEM